MEIDKKELKEILNEQKKEYQDYIGAIAENSKSQTQLLAESVSGIQEQLIAIRDMVAKNTEDIEMIKVDIEIIKSDVQFIKNELKHKVDRDEFEALEKRVLFLENKIER